MEKTMIAESTLKKIKMMQRNEITEYHIYTRVAKFIKDDHNRALILKIANDEKAHEVLWMKYTQEAAQPDWFKVVWYTLLARILGFTFALKLMEMGEIDAQSIYLDLMDDVEEARQLAKEEDAHERELLDLLDEERLHYVGSMVLGLNDALVELTGAIAGLSFALQNTRIIALSGLVTGISATLSMMSSEYLSSRAEGAAHPLKAAGYTGIMYIFVVVVLVLPYLFFDNAHYLYALMVMLASVVVIILGFTYYVSVAQGLPFKRRFLEMVVISMSVALISFIVGSVLKQVLGIEL